MRKLKLAVIGCGGRGKCYMELAKLMRSKYQLVAAADPLQVRLDKLKAIAADPQVQDIQVRRGVLRRAQDGGRGARLHAGRPPCEALPAGDGAWVRRASGEAHSDQDRGRPQARGRREKAQAASSDLPCPALHAVLPQGEGDHRLRGHRQSDHNERHRGRGIPGTSATHSSGDTGA